MIALTILAILGVMSYRAVSAATERHFELSSQFQRWRDIARFFQMTEADVLQVVERSAAPGVSSSISIVPASDLKQSGLTMLKLDGSNGGVERRAYLHEGSRIVLVRWREISTGLEPAKAVILENVAALRFIAVGSDGQRNNSWPSGSNTALGPLPAAIEIELELPDVGTLRRFYAVR
jgi:general secretion pathway protein J